MERNIKTELDELVPIHITLYDNEKDEIVRKAKQRISNKKRRSFSFKPAFISIAMLLIIGFFITPSILNEFFISSQLTPQKVTIDGLENDLTMRYDPLMQDDALNHSIYIDSTNELLYMDQVGSQIYSYNTETNERFPLIGPEAGGYYHHDFAASDKWLVYYEFMTGEFNIMNRQTSHITKVNGSHIYNPVIDGDMLYYSATTAITDHPSFTYNQFNLITLEETIIHHYNGRGSDSKPTIGEGKLVISHYVRTEESGKITTYYVYDLSTNELIGKYSIPYETARDLTLTDNKIYASLSNNDEPPILGYVDLSDGEFTQIEAPTFGKSEVHGNFVALSIPVEDSDTVKLYQIKNNKLVPLSIFDSINERLVKPRFTSRGTLVVNSEGPDRSMYLVKTNE